MLLPSSLRALLGAYTRAELSRNVREHHALENPAPQCPGNLTDCCRGCTNTGKYSEPALGRFPALYNNKQWAARAEGSHTGVGLCCVPGQDGLPPRSEVFPSRGSLAGVSACEMEQKLPPAKRKILQSESRSKALDRSEVVPAQQRNHKFPVLPLRLFEPLPLSQSCWEHRTSSVPGDKSCCADMRMAAREWVP